MVATRNEAIRPIEPSSLLVLICVPDGFVKQERRAIRVVEID
jgi:actin-like ATPase involved in cell morphogenesis